MSRTVTGVVPLEGRGALPLLDLLGEPLVVHAVRAVLGTDGVDEVVVTTPADPGPQLADALRAVRRLPLELVPAARWWPAGGLRTVLLHDPLCPMVPARFLEQMLREAETETGGMETDGAIVAVRPVTDTLKTVVADRILDTVDREQVVVATSPVVLATGPGEHPPTSDVAALVGWLRERGPVRLREAPALGRRVEDASAVMLLGCLAEAARLSRPGRSAG